MVMEVMEVVVIDAKVVDIVVVEVTVVVVVMSLVLVLFFRSHSLLPSLFLHLFSLSFFFVFLSIPSSPSDLPLSCTPPFTLPAFPSVSGVPRTPH